MPHSLRFRIPLAFYMASLQQMEADVQLAMTLRHRALRTEQSGDGSFRRVLDELPPFWSDKDDVSRDHRGEPPESIPGSQRPYSVCVYPQNISSIKTHGDVRRLEDRPRSVSRHVSRHVDEDVWREVGPRLHQDDAPPVAGLKHRAVVDTA